MHCVCFPPVITCPSTGLHWCFHPLLSRALAEQDGILGDEHWLAAPVSGRWIRDCSASLCLRAAASALRMLALYSIPGKSGHSSSCAPWSWHLPLLQSIGPVGKSQWGSPKRCFCLWSNGKTSFTAGRFPPASQGLVSHAHTACEYLLISLPSLLPVCMGTWRELC